MILYQIITLLHRYVLCQQSLDSSCDIACLKERIQKSHGERDKREERLLQSQALQQTGMIETMCAKTDMQQTAEKVPLILDAYLQG